MGVACVVVWTVALTAKGYSTEDSSPGIVFIKILDLKCSDHIANRLMDSFDYCIRLRIAFGDRTSFDSVIVD